MKQSIRDTVQYWREVIAENWQSASNFKKGGQIVAWCIATGLTFSGPFIWAGTVEKIVCSIPLVLWVLWLLLVAPVARDKRLRETIASMTDDEPILQFKAETRKLIEEYKDATRNDRQVPDEKYQTWLERFRAIVDERPYLLNSYTNWDYAKHPPLRCGKALTCLKAGRLTAALKVLSVKPPANPKP
ncbi:MAG: hypothetical protein SH850_21255 [Planctomycetaceae bacterium]|nr:hypothetical protein [Planctomycetaceae bacterium]